MRVRGALILRHALRATAASLVLLACGVTAGLALPRDPATAGARLALFLLGSLAALAAATWGLWRETPGFDHWLEGLEARFAGLRSWLRNSLDLEREAEREAGQGPGHTSRELADAVRAQAVHRLEATPLADTVPKLGARAPLTATVAATLSLVAAFVLAPAATRGAWSTLWSPASAAPPLTLVVDPGDVTVVPGASVAVHARIEGSAAAPRLLGDGPAPAAVLESTAGGGHRWRFDLCRLLARGQRDVRDQSARGPEGSCGHRLGPRRRRTERDIQPECLPGRDRDRATQGNLGPRAVEELGAELAGGAMLCETT